DAAAEKSGPTFEAFTAKSGGGDLKDQATVKRLHALNHWLNEGGGTEFGRVGKLAERYPDQKDLSEAVADAWVLRRRDLAKTCKFAEQFCYGADKANAPSSESHQKHMRQLA